MKLFLLLFFALSFILVFSDPTEDRKVTRPVFHIPVVNNTLIFNGRATLHRQIALGKLTCRIETDLPNAAYTVWWIVVNNPEFCAGAPCTETEIIANMGGIDSSVFWATGKVVRNGRGKFKGTTFTPSSGGPEGEVLFGPGLVNIEKAEVQIIVRTHGPPNSDDTILAAQLTTFAGGCMINTCEDIRAAIFGR